MKKIKILYTLTMWRNGGIEKYILNILDYINHDKYLFDIAIPGEYEHESEIVLKERKINVIHYSVDNWIQQINSIKKILENGDYDIVHVMQSNMCLDYPAIFSLTAIAERKKYHYKIINHSHSAEDITRKISPVKKMVRNYYRRVLRYGFKKADLLAACSAEAGNFMYGYNKKNNIYIFYNGINLDKFILASKSEHIHKWRNKYGINNDNINFVIVARMCEDKNPLFVIDVIKELSYFVPNICLTWVGDGEMANIIIDRIDKAQLTTQVNLLGYQEHIEEILACCDFFLLPSRREGAPLVLVEAQAAGMQAFVSDCVPNIGNCGGVRFVEFGKSAKEWAKEISKVLNNDIKIDMNLLEKFDIEETVKKLEKDYMQLIYKQSL